MTLWEPIGVSTGAPPSLIVSFFHPCIAEIALDSRHPMPWHCYSAHPVWWVHHPGWCLSLNFSSTPPGNFAGNEYQRGEGCDPGTQHNDKLLSPSAGFAILHHVFQNWCLPGMWGWWCCSSIFGQGHLYFQTILSLGPVRCQFPCWRLGWWTRWGAPQMPMDLQGHSGHLVVWGCGPQSGY